MPCWVVLTLVFLLLLNKCITKMSFVMESFSFLFFLSVSVVFSLDWLYHNLLASSTWQGATTPCSVWGWKYQSSDSFFLFFLCKHACRQFLMSDGVYLSFLYINIGALMCGFVYLCVCDPNDPFFRCFCLAVSTLLVTAAHITPPLPPFPLWNLAEIGHFSVSGQTIHVGTR